MKPGQVLTRWWQEYVLGRLLTPQDICACARAEALDPAKSSDRFFGIPVDSPTWDVPVRLQAPSFIGSTPQLKQFDRADWLHVDHRLMYWSALFQEMAKKRGIPLYVHSALRGKAEQDRAVAAGNSKAAYPSSAHNIGEAVDIVHGVFHWEMSRQEWALLHVLGRLALERVNARLNKDDKLSLTWGGDFKSLYDPAHWEITDFRTRRRALPDAPPVRATPKAILLRGL